MKSYHIQTFGCQMNEYDSERTALILEEKGFLPQEDISAADVVILNTCSVREKPQHKVDSTIGRLRRMQQKSGRPAVIGIMGCVAQQEGENFLKRFPCVNFVIGTDMAQEFSAILDEVLAGGRVSETSWRDGGFSLDPSRRKAGLSAHVSIMKGCDNFCSYCIVPYVRGREKSRAPEEIISEINILVERGVREVTLLGQNVNSYGKDLAENTDFPSLLDKVARVEGIKRLRFVTSHPKDFSRCMVETIAVHDNICPYIHLPVQSGSDKILKKMFRGYTAGEYLEKIVTAREIIPGLAFSSDFITGFPGETQSDFEATLNLLKTVQYESIFAFNYSPRPGTKAAQLVDDVPRDIKSARLEALIAEQENITAGRYAGLTGEVFEVMVEGHSKRDQNAYTGRTVHNRIMNFTCDKSLSAGDIAGVKLVEAKRNSLYGVLE